MISLGVDTVRRASYRMLCGNVSGGGPDNLARSDVLGKPLP